MAGQKVGPKNGCRVAAIFSRRASTDVSPADDIAISWLTTILHKTDEIASRNRINSYMSERGDFLLINVFM